MILAKRPRRYDFFFTILPLYTTHNPSTFTVMRALQILTQNFMEYQISFTASVLGPGQSQTQFPRTRSVSNQLHTGSPTPQRVPSSTEVDQFQSCRPKMRPPGVGPGLFGSQPNVLPPTLRPLLVVIYCQYGRVVKAPDLKSGGLCPRRFESCC